MHGKKALFRLMASVALEVGSEIILKRGHRGQFEVATSNSIGGRIEVGALTVSGVGLEV